MTQPAVDEERGHRPHPVSVIVNKKPVTFEDKHVTGLEIKQTAIAQGVTLEPNFTLYQVKGNGRLDPIADDERVTLNDRDEFRAVAPDDNSAA